MVRTHFRPSDDAVIYDFNIPGNAMAAVELGRLTLLLESLCALYDSRSDLQFPWATGLPQLEALSRTLEASIRGGISAHGTMQFNGQRVFAYEVDGFGNSVFMDDANVPSLLSLPLLGYVSRRDPLYLATRQLVLSDSNPWYFKGSLGIGGVGGPHLGVPMIWPMSLIVQAWTSDDVDEVAMLLRQLISTATPNSLIHESFHKDTFAIFSRPWFAWANTFFGDLVLQVVTDPVMHSAANLSKPVDLVALVQGWSVDQSKLVI